MSKTSLKAEETKRLRQNEKKWTSTLMEAGWTVIPSVIIERQQALGLDPLDVNIILHLATYWWYSDNLPHPSKKTIAKCIGVDPSTIRRRIAAMEKAGFIKRIPRKDDKYGQQSNEYQFDGLINSAIPFAEEKIKEKKERKKEDEKRITRKRPIRLVKSTDEND